MNNDKKDIFKIIITVLLVIVGIGSIALFVLYIYAQFNDSIDKIAVQIIPESIAALTGGVLLWSIASLVYKSYEHLKG